MAAGEEGPRPAAPLADAVWLAVAAFVVSRLLAQDTFYGPDGRIILKMTMSGLVAHPHHFFYVPMLRASHVLVAAGGGSWYDAGLLLSQMGVALAAFAWHRAGARLGLPRGPAAVLVGLCLTAPAILFFASVIELHAPFLAFAGLATYAAARLADRPSLPGACGLGLTSGLAVGAHATGHLLWLWLAPMACCMVRQRQAPRRWLWLLAAAGVAHAATALSLAPVLRGLGADVRGGAAAARLMHQGLSSEVLRWLPAQAWHDWLRPFAPLSVVALLALRRGRCLGVVLLLGLAASLAVTLLLMAPTTENGAYLVPLVWPAALLVVRTLPRWWWWTTMAVGTLLGVRWIAAHDDPAFGRQFVADVRTVAAGAPVELVCGQHREFDACMIFAPELPWRELINEAALPPEAVPRLVAGMREWVAQRTGAGGMVLLTEGTLAYLLAPIGPELRTGPLLRQAIEREFELEPAHGVVLRAWRLQPR